MSASYTLRSFFIGAHEVQLYVPDTTVALNTLYSPYWGKVWPAAIGLCGFLQKNLRLIQQKTVLEIAAGLGLPSIYAASFVSKVYCNDIEPAAMELVKQSALHNNLSNVYCTVADWNNLDVPVMPDIILLSDVNYEPGQFEQLRRLITYYLKQRCTVLLSTPQRLMAKPFIEQLLPYCTKQEEIVVNENNINTPVSIFVLQL